MPTTQASPAVGATRPLRRRAATGRGRDFTPNAVFQEGKGKTDALTPLSQAYFFECCQGQALRRASATLTEIEYPLLVKGYSAIPLPATAATPLSPRRPPPPMRVGYADHAGVAGRRGYAPATQARCDGEGEGLHTKRSLQEGKGKTDALTLLSQAYFSVLSRSSSSARKRDLDRDRIPAFSKAGIQASPPPPPRLRRSPRRPPPPMRVGYADHAGVAGRRGYAPATQARCDGEGEGLHTKRSLPRG